MGDESPTPLVMEFIKASEVVITVHQARSHDEFRSPDLNFTVYAAMTIVSQMEGSGRPERHRRRSDLLRTCHRHQVGTARPKARSDRRKSSGGSADGRVQSSVSSQGTVPLVESHNASRVGCWLEDECVSPSMNERRIDLGDVTAVEIPVGRHGLLLVRKRVGEHDG